MQTSAEGNQTRRENDKGGMTWKSMVSTRGSRVNSHPMAPQPAHVVDRPRISMDPSFSAHPVALSRLNTVVQEETLLLGRTPLAEIRRNDSLLTRGGVRGDEWNILAVANVPSPAFPDPYFFNELMVIGDTTHVNTSTFVHLITPNSRTNSWLTTTSAFAGSNAPLFGMLDRCVYPDCVQCSQSAMCVAGHMVFAVQTRLTTNEWEAPLLSYKIGDVRNRLNFSMSGWQTLLTRPFFPLEFLNTGLTVTAKRLGPPNDHEVEIEFTRSER